MADLDSSLALLAAHAATIESACSSLNQLHPSASSAASSAHDHIGTPVSSLAHESAAPTAMPTTSQKPFEMFPTKESDQQVPAVWTVALIIFFVIVLIGSIRACCIRHYQNRA
ncbi:UNVERIFIED_CONTAM: hypothetical protein HDU68_006993 [Siphonaria sp. JEL0065]|nr:hypothetical protein HDU68_006993 [Siphonaria sp. JEL0065]